MDWGFDTCTGARGLRKLDLLCVNIAGKKDCPISEKVTRKNSATGLRSAHRGAQVTGLESERTLKSLPPRAEGGGQGDSFSTL